MSLEVVRGTNQKPVSSMRLAELLSQQVCLSGQLFIGYPIIGTSEGPQVIDALLVSNEIGVVIFDLIEGGDTCGYELRQDDSANKLEARLRLHRNLLERRDLRVPIHTISFAPAIHIITGRASRDYPLANDQTFAKEFRKFKWENSDSYIYQSTLSAIESISTIRQSRVRREVQQENSRGAKLKKLEDSIWGLYTK